MATIDNWKNFGWTMDKSKANIPKQCRIGDTSFTSLATIGVNLYTRHAKNIKHVHKT